MKRLTALIIGITLLISCTKSAVEQEINSVMQRYLRAAVDHDGVAVGQTLTSGSFDWWSSLIEKARKLKKDEVRALSLYEQISLLFLRARLGRDGLKETDGKSFITISYTRGWNSSQALKKIHEAYPECKRTFVVKGDSAVLNLAYEGQPVKGHFAFKREAEGWRLDAIDQSQMVAERTREAFAVSGLSEIAFIERMVASGVGKPFDPDWWNP